MRRIRPTIQRLIDAQRLLPVRSDHDFTLRLAKETQNYLAVAGSARNQLKLTQPARALYYEAIWAALRALLAE